MINDIIKIELQMEKSDFGLNDNLVEVFESSKKLVEYNKSIMNENYKLKVRIKELEDRFLEIEKLNTNLNNEIIAIKDEYRKVSQTNNFNLSLIKDLGKSFLNKLHGKYIDETEWITLT